MNLKTILDAWRRRLRGWIGRLVEQKWIDVGLRAKMGILVTAGLAGLLTVFALLGISTARQVAHQVLSERVMLARMSATTLDSTLYHIESLLSVLASQPVLSDPESSLRERAAALRPTAAFDQDIYLLDEKGQLLASTAGAQISLEWETIPAVQNALQVGSAHLSVIPGSRPWVVVAVPVTRVSGAPSSALATLIDFSDPGVFTLGKPFDLGLTGTLDVVDANGWVLFSTRAERVMTQSDQEQILSKLFVAGEPNVEACLGCYEEDSSVSQDEMIAFAPLSQAPWGVVIRQKSEDVLSPVRRLTLRTLILGMVTVVGALGLVWVTTNSVIKPVQSLKSAAERIAQGDLDTPVESYLDNRLSGRGWRNDEIGALAGSFVAMRRQLKRSMDEVQALNRELDGRVQERTQQAIRAQLDAQAVRDDLRAIIDSLSDELVVIGVSDLRIQQVNKAAQGRSGSQVDLIGQPCSQVLHRGQPCQPPNCECPVPAVLASGESVQVTHVHSCDGEKEACYVDIVASPMRDADGCITRIVELTRDVTEEKRIKASLLLRNQQLAILNAVATTVNQSLNLEDILGRALDEVLRLTEIDAGAVFLLEDALGSLKLMAYRGLSKEAARMAAQMGMLDGSCGGVIEKGQVILVPDLSRYRGRRARSLKHEKLTTLVHVPLTAKGCVLGSMCVGTRHLRTFTPEDQELLTALGSQIAVAIENARLYAEVQYKEHVRGELFNKAITAQEEERKRIARELHDDTSQRLTALLYAAEEGLEMEDLCEVRSRLETMRDLAQHTLDGVHKLIFDLRPSMLDHLGLVPALRWFASSRLEPRGMRVHVEETSQSHRLPAEVETALFRVVQEAIQNIARHSAARNVDILFDRMDQTVLVSIKDDGYGFNLAELNLSPDSTRGLGLMGMRERVELLGGTLEIITAPGLGTRIDIQAPFMLEEKVYA